jgi:prepilin-type processing-associated H-X9-DG protein
VVKIGFLRRGLGVPMSTAMLVGQGLLLAWNFLVPAHLAWQLRTLNGAGLPVAEGMRVAWQWSWWLMLAGTGCLVAAGIGKDAGREREAASGRCFFNHSLMGWLFSGLLLAACVIHQRVLCYAFSIRCYDADFLPIAVAVPIIALGLLRRYRTCHWALESLLGMLPLTMVAYVMGRLASPASTWLSVGILWQPLLLLGVAAVLLVIEGWRHRSPVLPYLLVAYGLAGILLACAKPGSPQSLNWEWAVGGAVLAMIVAGLWRRQPWTAAVGLLAGTVGALNSSRVESLLTHGHMNPVPTLLALSGLILLSWYFYFGRTYPRRLADVGALLVAAFAMFAYDGQHFGLAMAVVGVSVALLGVAVAWRFGNLPIGFLLSLPLAFCVLFSFRKMTDWHFVGIGFLLLVLGTAFSLWKQTINKLLRLVFFRYRRQVMGRPRNGQPKGADNTLLVVLTLLFIVVFLAGMLLPALSMSRGKARQISCASNLKQIGLALRMYSSDWGGQFPPEDGAAGLERLRQQGYLENAKMFTCPSTSTKAYDGESLTEETVDYGYRGGLSEDSPLDTPLAWDKPDNHVKYGNVLYVDGHVSGESGRDWRERAERR